MSGLEERSYLRRICLEYVLVGILLSRDGDSKRLRDILIPELLMSEKTRRCLAAIQGLDRNGVDDFLKDVGVVMGTDELATDAIIRTFIGDRKAEVERIAKAIDDAIKSESKRQKQDGKKKDKPGDSAPPE